MAYGNKLLSIDALLAAWQNRNQMEGNSAQNAMQQKLAEQQLEAQDLANKKSELELSLLTSPFNIPRESWAGSGNANTPGTDKAISDNLKMQKLSMLTGKSMPNMGITGYGGHGGYGGGGRDDTQPAATGGMNYYGPDHSVAPNTVEAATALGNVMGAGIPKQEPTIADLLADEQANVAGMNSLINQATNKGLGDKVSNADLISNMEPTKMAQAQTMRSINTDIDTWIKSGSNTPPKEWDEEMRNAAVTQKREMENARKLKEDASKTRVGNREAGQKELSGYFNKLYSSPDWKDMDDPMPAKLKEQIKKVLPGFVKAAKSKNPPQEPDIQNLIDSFKGKNPTDFT